MSGGIKLGWTTPGSTIWERDYWIDEDRNRAYRPTCNRLHNYMRKILVGRVHQGSCLSPLLFIIVMVAISEHVRREVPWDMLYADDLIIVADKEEAGIQARFSDWQWALESKELKINVKKT